MKSHYRVVVIGGGIGGCSTLYHLTREGWTDVALVERNELTSGTTWHSAAQVTNFGAVQTMVGLKSHSIKLYKELASDPDNPINYHHASGGIRLASTQEHLDGYHHFVSLAKGMGVDFEVIDAEECAKRHPLIEKHELLGGLWDPLDGDIDPAQLTQALAREARKAGADIFRHNPVENIYQKANGEWVVQTKNGDITCEKLVNAGGYRVNEIGAMLGIEYPVISMEHMYFLTEPLPEVEAFGKRVPLLRDPLDDFYSRQEKNGLLVGIYEQRCKTWGMDGIDPNFVNALCPDDLDRCLDNMERVFKRMPCLERTGIHSIINGPITYSADGNPLVGKTPGFDNLYSIIGLRAGLGEGGGHGKILAEIIVHGESEWDTWCLDPARFTRHANTEFTALKAVEDYQNEFRFHMPHEARPAGRLAKTTPIYPVLKAQHAEFTVVNGWERAMFYKPHADFEFKHSFRFNETEDIVAAEVKAVSEKVGLMEVNGFTRYQIEGPKAAEWLESLMCSNVPKKVGKVGLCYFLTDKGNVLGEATITKLSDNTFWYGAAAAAEYKDMDWLRSHLPTEGVEITNLTNSHTILSVTGPNARELLSSLSPRTNWSNEAFPWLTAQSVYIGHGQAIALRVSFSGELGWELHIPNEQLLLVHTLLTEAGKQFGLTPFGTLALESMRLEKGYRHWKADLITEFDPFESNLDRFIKLDKPQFPGKAALMAKQGQAHRKKFVTLTVNCDIAPAHPGDSICVDGKVIGTVTSAAFGHRVNKNIVLGFIDPAYAIEGQGLEVEIIGKSYSAQVTQDCLYDEKNERVRS
ncbi:MULTISPECIES: FAD-dependent oxidoreductase [unclassified Vibrio]|uniref:FAD-dependent oxidoreductase n=1 Tax=Vibrio sp. HB236076 TaxID=3232307 RepID=A0AB39HII1_9VIBR|nr:FAD-dependent oxidoreductase [Vibrio sp. HB161653]MDP5255025.1 FAD-dependent oxidoreductase [Vibrio sp. HB161653]